MADEAPIGEIILYQTEDGRTRVECRFAEESLWLTQALIAELYDKDVRTVGEHLQNLFEEGEVDPMSTTRKFRIVRREGVRDVERELEHYNLDAILAVGYRVRSARGVAFRRWATERLREYLVKGFTLDDERLKNPPAPGAGVPDYFDGLLDRIRDIRASECRMYLRVREIFALAADYDPNLATTTQFFQTAQTTSWRRPLRGCAARPADPRAWAAENPLSREEINHLNRIATTWLDIAEEQARRRKQGLLKDWDTELEQFTPSTRRESTQ